MTESGRIEFGGGTSLPSHPAWHRGALVIGGNYRSLGVVRSLGRHGIPVWVLTDEHSLARTSRYSRHHAPWPLLPESQQRDYLLDLGLHHGLDDWTIFPTTDDSAALVARHYPWLASRFRLTTPNWEALRWAYDKRLTYQLATALKIDHPRTWYPDSRDDVAELDCMFPVILKPAFKEQANRFTMDKAWRVDDRRSLLERYDEACSLVSRDLIMVQELIPGGGESQFSYAALCVDGRPVASMVARRTRQYPMDFGRASTYVETVDQPEIEAIAQRLLARIAYTGLVEVEFKHDPRDGRFLLLDISARVWGWHTLGHRAGVDFPHLLWRLSNGEPVPHLRAKSGIRWIHFVADLPAAATAFRRGQLSPRTYLQSLRAPIEFAIFAADDPLPALMELPLFAHIL
jgi:D-aspartate ligase